MKKITLPILLLTTLLATGCGNFNPGPSKYYFYEFNEGIDVSTLHGTPWLNTSIIGMANKVKKPSAKDDFFTYSNYDVLTTNTIPEGNSKGGGLLYNTVDLVNQRIEGIMKDNNTFKALKEMVKVGDKQAVKAEADSIINMSKTEFYNAYLNNVELFRGSSAFVSMTNEKGTPTIGFYTDSKNLNFMVACTMFLLSPSAEDYPVVMGDIVEACGYQRSDADKLVQDAFGALGEFVQVFFHASSDVFTVKVKDLDSVFHSSVGIKNIVKELGMNDEDDISYMKIAKDIVDAIGDYFDDEEKLPNLKKLFALCKLFENRYLIGAEGVKNLYINKFAGTPLADPEISDNSSLDEIANYATNILFPQVVERQYCEDYITASAREKTATLISEVMSGFTDVLKNNDWLSEETKNKALEKMAAMKFEAFYSDEYEDYKAFTYTTNNLLGAYDEYSEYFIDGVLLSAFSTDVLHAGVPVTTVNAAYAPTTNSFRIFHGIVSSFIDDNLTKEQLYGRIGVVIGHEITHGFDSTGSLYDKDGKVADWWTKEDKDAFNTKINKMISYYENDLRILNDDTKMTGSLLTGEIIADMGGMKTLIEMGKKIEGFNWDEFFKNNSMFYNFSYTEAAVREANESDPHPIPYLRVNVTVAQFDQFLKTYGVNPGDGMYIAPNDRVAIW